MKRLLLLFAYASFFTVPPGWTADTPHPLGFRSSPHGVPGAPIETHPKFAAAPLPSSASVREFFYKTDQKKRGACVVFSGSESADAVYQRDNGGAHIDWSELDGYQQCLVLDGSFPNDNGTYGGTMLKVFRTGVLLEKTWPYSMALDMLPPVNDANAAERARNVTVKSYSVPNNDGGRGIKQCIANLRVAPDIGSRWYNNTFDAKLVKCSSRDLKGKRFTVQRYVLPYPKGNPVGGHEVPVISYDDNMKFPDGSLGGVEIHNHWGEWGSDTGSAWISYRWAFNPRIVEDVVAIELVAKPIPKVAP